MNYYFTNEKEEQKVLGSRAFNWLDGLALFETFLQSDCEVFYECLCERELERMAQNIELSLDDIKSECIKGCIAKGIPFDEDAYRWTEDEIKELIELFKSSRIIKLTIT